MNHNPTSFSPAGLFSCSGIASGSVILTGVLVLFGWAIDSATLKSIFPGLVTMKANTAIAFILAGLALGLLRHEYQRLSSACAFFVALAGLLTIGEYLLEWDLGIDQWLFHEDMQATDTVAPGRMSPATAVNFILVGLALLLLSTQRGALSAQLLTLMGLGLTFLAIVGYAYDVRSLYQFRPYASMALHTTVAFVVLGVGILWVRPHQGLMAIVTSAGVGGMLARYLLPTAIGVPFLLGWISLLGQQAGLYKPPLDLTFLALSNIGLLAILVWWTAGVLNRLDCARQRAIEDLQQLNQTLEHRVVQRTGELSRANTDLVREITARKELEVSRAGAEEALRASEHLLSGLFERDPDAIIVLNRNGEITRVNAQTEALFGHSRENLLGHGIEQLVPERFRERHVRYRTSYMASPHLRPMGAERELYGLHKDGYEFPVAIMLSPLDELGLIIATVRDITPRQRVEEELRRLNVILEERVQEVQAIEERYRQMAECLHDGLYIVNQEGCIIFANTALVRLTGYTLEELIGRPSVQLYAPEFTSVFQARRQRAYQGLIVRPLLEAELVTSEGRQVPVELSVTKHIEYGRVIGRITVVRDLTERKLAEEALKTSLHHKEILLKEIHHRVKNNLQVVASLLYLQVGQLNDPAVAAVFEDTLSRIKSMAFIHESLYRTGDLAHFNFTRYIENLGTHLFQLYATDTSPIRLHTQLNVPTFDLDTAIPCVLILNELLTNALKYAFPNGCPGDIYISAQSEMGHVNLSVRDTGVGLPDGFDFRHSESLGLQLVCLLTEQLRGTVDITSAGGTIVTVTFPYSRNSGV